MGMWEQYRVSVPEGECDGMRIERFTVTDVHTVENIRLAFSGRLPCQRGTYTRLIEGGCLWMSDTPAEVRDHIEAMRKIERGAKRVLIMGLGLGMIVQTAINAGVEHIDVVEKDARVIRLVGEHYANMAADCGVGLTIHHADAYAIRWEPGTRWDVVWHDVWPSLCADNLPEMAKLKRSYGRRAEWQGCWGEHECRRYR